MANPEFELGSNEACSGKDGRYDGWVHYFQGAGTPVEPFAVDLGRTPPDLSEPAAFIEQVHHEAVRQQGDMSGVTRNLGNLAGISIQRDCLQKRHEAEPKGFAWQSHRTELFANIFIAAQTARSFPVDATRPVHRRAGMAIGTVPVRYSDFTVDEEAVFLPFFEPRKSQARRPDITGRALPIASPHLVVRTIDLRADRSRVHRRALLMGALRAGLGRRQIVVYSDGRPVPEVQDL